MVHIQNRTTVADTPSHNLIHHKFIFRQEGFYFVNTLQQRGYYESRTLGLRSSPTTLAFPHDGNQKNSVQAAGGSRFLINETVKVHIFIWSTLASCSSTIPKSRARRNPETWASQSRREATRAPPTEDYRGEAWQHNKQKPFEHPAGCLCFLCLQTMRRESCHCKKRQIEKSSPPWLKGIKKKTLLFPPLYNHF